MAAPERLEVAGAVFARIGALAAASLLLGYWKGAVWGLSLLSLGLAAEILVHLLYVTQLVRWLGQAELTNVPTCASRVWGRVFGAIYKNRKDLEKNTRRLADREDRYRKTLAALPEGIVLVKSDWTLAWCNLNAERILGIESEAHAGVPLPDLVRERHFVHYLREKKFETPLTWSPEHSERMYSLRVVVVDRKNALLILRDVSKQLRLDSMRRDFVANVSHELRTPLTVLAGFLDLAGQTADPATGAARLQPQHLHLMQDQAKRMLQLVNDLLTLSRLETGADRRSTEILHVNELVETITREIQVMAGKTHRVECETEPVDMVCWPDEIRSAVVNLMTNAVRYTPAGGTVKASCSLDGQGRILVSVTDNGIGIAKKDIPRLTERFYRVDKSRSRDTGGTGLGLAIVKHVLLHAGGELRIDSEPGRGSAFTLVFPASLRPSMGAQPTCETPPEELGSSTPSA